MAKGCGTILNSYHGVRIDYYQRVHNKPATMPVPIVVMGEPKF